MENIRNFLLTLTAAISNCSMYSKDHPAVDEFTRRSAKVLDILLREAGRLDIMHIENKFIINERPLSAIGLQGIKLINRLKRKGISYVNFLPAVTVDELKQFVNEMVETDKTMPLFPHIKTGVLDVQIDEDKKVLILTVRISQVLYPDRSKWQGISMMTLHRRRNLT